MSYHVKNAIKRLYSQSDIVAISFHILNDPIEMCIILYLQIDKDNLMSISVWLKTNLFILLQT